MCKNHILLAYPDTDKKDIIVYEDEGFSGGNTNRPEYQKMLGEIRNNNIKAVVCYRLDRISRNVGDFANLKKDFDEYDVDFISISDKFDTSTPAGIAMMMMVSVFAQLERDTIAERIRDNMHELAKSGRWLGGITPTGYKSQQIVGSVTIDGKTRKAFKLDIIPDEAETIKLIFAKFIETNSLTQTETYLLQQHIKTKNGKNYTRFSIKAILQNLEEDFNLTKDKIRRYFEIASKENLSYDFEVLEELREQHSMSLVYLGILFNDKLNINIKIENKDIHYPFNYVWNILCFYHDLGYIFENDKSYVYKVRKRNQDNQIKGYNYKWNTINSRICFDCGFESQRTFNRVFKERYRVTPREYRTKKNSRNFRA
mgnify:CR=1 FL=1